MSSKKAKQFNYGNTMKSLEDLLQNLETDDIDVDAAISKFEEGMKLIAELEDYLKTAENKVKKIQKQFASTSSK